MKALSHPIQTAADVMAMLEQSDLPDRRKRDLLSAIRRICDMTACSPATMKLEVPALRARLAAVRPAAHGISPQTFSNLRSLFVAALEMAGIIERAAQGAAKKDPAWAPLVAAIAGDKRLAKGLARFLDWCAWKGIQPASVDDGALQRFLLWLQTRTLHPRPRDLVRQIPTLWEAARALVAGWPATELTRISFRPVSPNLRWEDLPEGLRKDAEAYLKLRGDPDVFDNDPNAPKRPLAASTLHQQREHIRLATSVLVLQGKPVEALRGLADLVTVAAFKAVLGHYHKKAGGKANAFVVCLAKTLIDVARFQVRLPEDKIKELKRLASKLPAVPFDLTEKNKALLRELEGEELRARLVFLPEDLVRWVQTELQQGRLRFVEAQVAAAVAIQLVAPLRPENLIELNWSRHFKEPQGAKGKLLLYIPKDATKTKRRDLTFEFPPDLAEPLRWYRREILPRLQGDPHGDIFVSKGGKRKSQETISQQITEAIAERVGVHMTGHQFRHFAAVLYLEEHPEDFESVSNLLGHAWSKSTRIYAGSSSRRASRAYGEHVLEQRRRLQLRRRRRKGPSGPIRPAGGRKPQ